jgi:hypothetical protein
VEESTVKIILMRSEKSDADVFTKNPSTTIYDKHTAKLMVDSKSENAGDESEKGVTSRNGKGVGTT